MTTEKSNMKEKKSSSVDTITTFIQFHFITVEYFFLQLSIATHHFYAWFLIILDFILSEQRNILWLWGFLLLFYLAVYCMYSLYSTYTQNALAHKRATRILICHANWNCWSSLRTKRRNNNTTHTYEKKVIEIIWTHSVESAVMSRLSAPLVSPIYHTEIA